MRNMRMTGLRIGLGAALALPASAQLKPQSASGTTNATVSWAARGAPMRLVTVDATSDKAGSKLTWSYGGAVVGVAVAAGTTATTLVCRTGTLASNDVALLQNAAGAVVARTVWGRSTNAATQITFGATLGTNLAVGDAIMAEGPTNFTTVAQTTSNKTIFYLTTTNGLTLSNGIVIVVSGGVWKSTITNYTQTAAYLATIGFPNPSDLEAGDAVYVQVASSTNYGPTNFAAALSATNLSLTVTGTNGFAAGAMVLLKTTLGNQMRGRTVA